MKAVLFDLFETLITERENGKNIRDFGTPECDCPASLLGIRDSVFEREWVIRRPSRMNGGFPDYYTVLSDICMGLDLAVDEELLHSLDEKRVAAKRLPYQHIDHRVLDVLDTLKSKGLKIGLVSNCSAEEVQSLFSCPLVDFFDETILSFEVGLSKPNKEIYVLACERLKVSPEECIFIGDGGASELIGAKNAGIQAYRATWFHNRTDIGNEFRQIDNPIHILDLI